ncbi:hypothetical protein FACS1894216_06880 [Synergistales bacterium]|nr:hypothetical protein FACS1894216_06880 [Synergistales bacterium]
MRTVMAILAFLLQLSVCGAARGNGMDFIWWRMSGQDRTPDAGMTVAFDLVFPEAASADEIDVIYISSPLRSYREYGSSGPGEVYRKKIEMPPDGENVKIVIYSGRTERIDLRARVRFGDRVCYAQTITTCYGQSGHADGEAERIAAAPDWPISGLPAAYFRAQTGMPVRIIPESASKLARVYENGALSAILEPGDGGEYSYTPPHDDALRKGGPTAKKDLVFEVSTPENDGALSFYLPVYRQFYGNLNLSAGIALLLAAVFVCLLLVARADRRFQWR